MTTKNGEYAVIDSVKTSDSNSYGDWKYGAYVSGEADNSAYNHDEIPAGSYTTWLFQGHFLNTPDVNDKDSGTYKVEPSSVEHDLIYENGWGDYDNNDITLKNEHPIDGSNDIEINVGVTNPVPSWISTSVVLYSEDIDSVDFNDTASNHEYSKWDLYPLDFPTAQDDNDGVWLDVEAQIGESGQRNFRMTSKATWDYREKESNWYVVHTETDSVSDEFFPEIV